MFSDKTQIYRPDNCPENTLTSNQVIKWSNNPVNQGESTFRVEDKIEVIDIACFRNNQTINEVILTEKVK